MSIYTYTQVSPLINLFKSSHPLALKSFQTSTMSISYLSDFPLHELSININSIKLPLLILGLIKFTLLQILLHRKLISILFSPFRSPNSVEASDDSATAVEKKAGGDESVCGGDMEMVLRSLGICNCDEKLPTRVDAAAIFEIFEETSPSLEEVREAFDVFDENRDGFIDEKELQRVLCALGLKEGMEMENCRRMIGGFDEDGDGKIDFHEFVKFMENSLI